MFPETDFHRRKNIMFLLVEGVYYNVLNAEPVNENYLTLCDLRFPLKRGRELIDEEKAYMKKNQKIFDEFKSETEKEINERGKCLEEVQQDFELKEDVVFFLSNICVPHDRRAVEGSYIKNDNEEEKFIFPQILDKNYAVVNERVYPLVETTVPIFVNLGKNYTIDPSELDVDGVESLFQKSLIQSLRRQAIENSEKAKETLQKISEIEKNIVSLEIAVKISKHPYCYEFGDIGYDTSLRAVYWLIPPHHNRTTHKNYGKGQSAATIPLNNGVLGTVGKFAERENVNSPFKTSMQAHCLGFSLYGNSLEEKMQYLKTFVGVVKKNRAFHA